MTVGRVAHALMDGLTPMRIWAVLIELRELFFFFKWDYGGGREIC